MVNERPDGQPATAPPGPPQVEAADPPASTEIVEGGRKDDAKTAHKRPLASRLARIAAQTTLGLLVGCAIAEVAFSLRDRGAFPHIHLYVADPELGVRLKPSSSEKISFGPNPATEVRINAQGYRGSDWPASGDDEVLVVGDSQVFGLGVEESDTMAAQLATLSKKTVLNGGVPTYGPDEYARVVGEVLEKRKVKTVVFVVNFANDLYEASHPNKNRHSVWDGWAVDKGSAPASITHFPGRELLYTKSHAVYAFRQFWYAHGPIDSDPQLSPRRTWRDLSLAGVAAEDQHEQAVVDTAKLAQKHQVEIVDQAKKATDAKSRVDGLIESALPGSTEGANAQTFATANASPGDIVGHVDSGESEEPVYATAEMIREGALYRQKLEERLREKAKADAELAKRIESTFGDVKDSQAKLDELKTEPPPVARAWSPIAPALRTAKAACDAHGARLFVVALPLDVQISSDEWKKYGATPVDMSPSEILIDDVLDAATALGAIPVDPRKSLRDAEPGAFLYGDIHMTPKGHRALAEAVLAAMQAPPPLPMPKPGLPAGRTRVPTAADWKRVREVVVHGSDAAGCSTHMVHEWLLVDCKRKGDDGPATVGIAIIEGGHGEAFITGAEGEMVLLVPVLEGDHLQADFSWADRTQRLSADFAKGSRFPDMAFGRASKKEPSAFDPPLSVEPFCSCMKTRSEFEAQCVGSILAPNPDCAAAFEKDCDRLLSCLEGDPGAQPACEDGQAHAGTLGRCAALCSDDRPCKKGACTSWQGAHACL